MKLRIYGEIMTKKFIKALSYDKRDIICNVLLEREGNKGVLFKALLSQRNEFMPLVKTRKFK